MDLIFDSNSLFARTWFAVTRSEIDLNRVVQASIYTVLSLLDRHNEKLPENPERLLFCWDGAHRPEKQRSPKPPGYHETIEDLKQVLTVLFGAKHAVSSKFEADDLVATAVDRSVADLVTVVSGDKDLVQLVNGRVRYYSLNEKCLLQNSYIQRKFGVKNAAHVPIALAIIGDRVDKVAGIPKWGPKKVQKLFETVTKEMSLEEAFARVDAQVPEEHKNAFYSSLEAVILNRDADVDCEPAPIQFIDYQVLYGTDLTSIAEYYDRVSIHYR